MINTPSELKRVVEKMDAISPVVWERHNFATAIYKNKDSKEPLFCMETKGERDIDVLKLAMCSAAAIVAVSALCIALKINKSQKKKLKKLKAKMKEDRKALRNLRKNN